MRVHRADRGPLTVIALTLIVMASNGGAQSTPADSSLAHLVRRILDTALAGGGTRDGQRYIAADSLARALFPRAGLPVSADSTEPITCPGSTTATGGPVPAPVGYRVRVGLRPAGDTALHVLSVSKSCDFVYRGERTRMGGFSEGVVLEIRRDRAAWRVVRMLHHIIT